MKPPDWRRWSEAISCSSSNAAGSGIDLKPTEAVRGRRWRRDGCHTWGLAPSQDASATGGRHAVSPPTIKGDRTMRTQLTALILITGVALTTACGAAAAT